MLTNHITVSHSSRPGSRGRLIPADLTGMTWLPGVDLDACPVIGTEANVVIVSAVTEREAYGPPRTVGLSVAPVGNGRWTWRVIASPWASRKAPHRPNHLDQPTFTWPIRFQAFDAATGEALNHFQDVDANMLTGAEASCAAYAWASASPTDRAHAEAVWERRTEAMNR